MMKKLMLGAAMSALMLSGAMAQTPAPSSPPAASPPPAAKMAPAKPEAAKPEAKPDESAAKPADKSAAKTAAADEKGKLKFVDSQQPEQLLASKFKGTNVVGDDNKKIGDVSDILFDKDGKIEAYVVSVGGFLGVGAKEVALAPSSFELMPDAKGGSPKLKLSSTKDQLKQAENFKAYEPPRSSSTTTGAGGGMGGGGSRGGGLGGR